jgi:multiple antibiotic resistance protein
VIAVWSTTAGSFVLALSALFSIVNPIAGALIFSQVTGDRGHRVRVALARRIGAYSAIVTLVSLWVGATVMSFFGISLGALRIAGGLVVAVRAWELLSAPDQNEDRKQEQAAPASGGSDVAFFPLTLPFTTGPGTISVAIALSSSRPTESAALAPFFAGVSMAAIVIGLLVALSYAFADRLVALLGPARSRIVTRLSAFLLLCIGTQILLNGIDDFAEKFLSLHRPAR